MNVHGQYPGGGQCVLSRQVAKLETELTTTMVIQGTGVHWRSVSYPPTADLLWCAAGSGLLWRLLSHLSAALFSSESIVIATTSNSNIVNKQNRAEVHIPNKTQKVACKNLLIRQLVDAFNDFNDKRNLLILTTKQFLQFLNQLHFRDNKSKYIKRF